MSQLASRGQLRMSFVRVALVVVPIVLLLGIASGVLAGSGGDDPWFAMLTKPSYMPSPGAFPVAWTILYILMGFALSLVIAARGADGRRIAIALFIVQLALNLAWSPLFFAAHRVSAAFVLILAIIVVATTATLAMARVRRGAAALMLPYLAWLCFAAMLTHAIDRLNPDAATLAPDGPRTQITL